MAMQGLRQMPDLASVAIHVRNTEIPSADHGADSSAGSSFLFS